MLHFSAPKTVILYHNPAANVICFSIANKTGWRKQIFQGIIKGFIAEILVGVPSGSISNSWGFTPK
jgi:hypothetical protein